MTSVAVGTVTLIASRSLARAARLSFGAAARQSSTVFMRFPLAGGVTTDLVRRWGDVESDEMLPRAFVVRKDANLQVREVHADAQFPIRDRQVVPPFLVTGWWGHADRQATPNTTHDPDRLSHMGRWACTL